MTPRNRNRRYGSIAVWGQPGIGRSGLLGALVVGLIATAFVASLPESVMAQPDEVVPTANESEPQPPDPAEDDRSDEVAIGLLAVVGVALLGLVMLTVTILGGNRVRRLARQSGRRDEPAIEHGDEVEVPVEGDELPEEKPIHPGLNGKPSPSDHP